MIRPVPGLSLERIAPDPKHPPWAPPCTIVEAMGLKDPGKEHEEAAQGTEKRIFVLNSLTETMVPFAPRDPRTVRWYTCGPTVYDSAHMGHARAYLTFDILRRIMQDYFNYHVLYQMNVTDLDDKIIRRARINKLMQEYRTRVCGSGSSLVEVVRDIQQARAAARSSLESSKEALDKPLPSTATSRMRDEYEEKLSVWKLKTEMLKESEARIDDAIRCASEEARPTEQGMDRLMDVSSELLGEWLDKHSGHEVKDHAVFEAHARHYEMEFWEDMRALNIQPPDMITRVTEYLPQIIRYIEKIVSNGFAYIASSSVYFDLEAYQKAGHDYPKLKPIQCALDRQTTAAEMEESEGVLGAGPGKADAGAPITASEPGATPGTGKRNPNDFALWKFSKPGEPAWDSPWGPGRPGWHIECSAMASDCLGENMDIHAGGCDLKFPHHDNELAQAEAYWGHGQWVNYFLHAGHLHIRGLKMAKSLKNFVTIRQALREHTADELRMMMILQPWHRPMNYSDQTVGEARERLRTIRSFFATVQNLERDQAYLHHEQRWDTDLEGRLEADITTMHTRVDSSLRDNFNTASATEAVLELVSATRRYLKELETCSTSCRTPNVPLVLKASRSIARLLTIFGLRFGSTVSRADPSECTTQSGTCLSERNQTPSLGDTVQALVQFREVVRRLCMSDSPTSERVIEGHILKECDRVRDQVLPCLGIKLEDVVAQRASGPATPLWSFEDPEVLLREQRQRDEKAMAAKKQKVESKLRQKQAEVSKWCEVQSVLCAREGKDGTVADAVPSVREDLSKSAVKKLEKERKAMQALCLEFEAKGGASFLQTLQGEVRILREQLESFGQKED